MRAALAWDKARRKLGRRASETEIQKLGVQYFLEEAEVVTAKNAAGFVKRHGLHWQKYGRLGIAKGGGQKPKLSIADAKKVMQLLLKGQTVTSDQARPYRNLDEAMALSKDISKLVQSAGYKSKDALWRRLRQVHPTLQRKKLRIYKLLDNKQKQDRKDAATALLKNIAENPDYLARTVYLDEATIYVQPELASYFIVDSAKPMPYVELEQTLSYNTPKLKCYVMVGIRGPLAVQFTTGSHYIPPDRQRPKEFKVC